QNLVGKNQVVDELREHIPLEGWMMKDCKRCGVLTDMVIHTVKTEMMKLVVEIECVGINVDAFDKGTGSSDGLQSEQADLNCVHALNKPHLHKIHVVPSKHEADQHSLCANPLPV
nr:hypothetical protein [Tanacetum cinerariifolium]